MNKPEKADLLEALDFGAPDAEEEGRKTLEVFIIPSSYPKVLKDEVGLILGNKGVGKTAVVEYLMEKGRDQGTIICSTKVKSDLHLDPEAIGFFENLDIIKHRYQFKGEWLRLLTQKIAISLINKKILLRKKYKPGKSLFNKITERLPSISPWVSPDGTLKMGGDITFGAQSQRDERINYRSLLKECNEILKKEDYRIWVLIDDIDDLFFPNLLRRDTAIASLLELWEAFRNNFSQIQLKIFARNDILRQLVFVGKPKLYGKFVILEWDKRKILHMIARRILSNQKIYEYCKSELDTDLSEIGVETNMSEEQLEKVFYTIFECDESREMSSKEFLISGKAVYATQKNLFKYRLETYLSEFKYSTRRHLYLNIMNVIRQGKKHFTRDELSDILKYIPEDRGDEPEESFNSLLRVLYDIGFMKPADLGDVDYAMQFELPRMYQHPDDDSNGNVFDWICAMATDALGILPREIIFILNEARQEELKLLRR